MDSLDRVSLCDLLLFRRSRGSSTKMQYASLIWLLGLLVALAASSELQLEPMEEGTTTHARTKRTLFLKKKILGAGLLGFGLGLAKGYKFGYHTGPEVHHVFLAPPPPPPPVRYVEYIEKPVFVPKYIEKPVFKPHDEYAPPGWSSQSLPDPSPVYGAPW